MMADRARQPGEESRGDRETRSLWGIIDEILSGNPEPGWRERLEEIRREQKPKWLTTWGSS